MKNIKDIPTSEIAELLNVTMPFVSHVKGGRKRFSAEQTIKLSQTFGIPLWEIRPDIYPQSIFESACKD